MHVLVLAESYQTSAYIQTRNEYYQLNGINVTVIDFKAEKNYVLRDVQVITYNFYKTNHLNFDVLILHAPNIKHHMTFLILYGNRFPRFVFFFHGHEVVRINDTYPKEYPYIKSNNIIHRIAQEIYDTIKLAGWHYYLPRISAKSDYVFVSRHFFDEFKDYVGLSSVDLNNRVHIINNPVGAEFLTNSYDNSYEKEYDLITIRSNMDDSTYCIDLVTKIARDNPELKFLIIGKGEWFKYNEKPNNITWIDRFINHEDMLKYINSARCALMPTRRDTQGVMSCEMATFGIPLITSDIEICKEIFEGFVNVYYMKSTNDFKEIFVSAINNQVQEKVILYDNNNTIDKELYLLHNRE